MFWEFGFSTNQKNPKDLCFDFVAEVLFCTVRKLPPRVSEPQTKKGARRIKSERFNLNLKSRPTCSADHNFNSTSNPKEK